MIAKTRKIPDQKNITKDIPSVRFVDPEYVYIPVTNARCPKGEIFINEGDEVKIGQTIGMRDGGFFEQPIHSTVSGEMVGYEKKFHRSGKMLECVVLKNDKKNIFYEGAIERSEEEIYNLTKEEVTEIVKQNSVVGLGGSGFPTYIKFQTKENIETIILNGVECEPYLTSDYRLMLEFPDRLFKGLGYMIKVFGAKRGVIAIKENKEDLYDTLTTVAKARYPELNIEIKKVGNYYPQGWEIETIKSAIGVKVPTGVLPAKLGIMVFNVSTAVAVYKALKYNIPVIKRFFTVTGDGIKRPQNFRVRVGTSIQELFEKCGGMLDGDKVLVLGGPMMGASLVRDDIIVSKSSTSVLAFNVESNKEEPCVRCASCVYSCPVQLQPVQIMGAVKTKNSEAVEKLNIKKCILCGMCSYVCTSKIHLTEYMRKAKKMVK